MATSVSSPFQNVTIPAGATQTYGVGGNQGTYYSFAISNAISVDPATQAILTIVNGCTSISSGQYDPGPLCAVSNVGTTEASFDLVLVEITN